MDKCPICRYPLDQCQCLHDYQYPFYAGSSHPDRSKRQRVVLDHLYILSEPQLRHVIELERRSNISYADPELTEIWDKLNAQFFNSKKNAENAKRIIEVDGSKSSEVTVCVICKRLNTVSGKKSETPTGNLKDGFILSAVER